MNASTDKIKDLEVKRVIDAIVDGGGVPSTIGIKDHATRQALEAVLDGFKISFDNITDKETRRVLQSLQR
jgi:hypothetical protein